MKSENLISSRTALLPLILIKIIPRKWSGSPPTSGHIPLTSGYFEELNWDPHMSLYQRDSTVDESGGYQLVYGTGVTTVGRLIHRVVKPEKIQKINDPIFGWYRRQLAYVTRLMTRLDGRGAIDQSEKSD